MSEVVNVDADERRRRAEARLAASRPSREAAAAGHARTILRGKQDDHGLVRESLAQIAAKPYRMSEEGRAHVLSMTEEDIEAVAPADFDNPPWTDEELERAVRERDARLVVVKRGARMVDVRLPPMGTLNQGMGAANSLAPVLVTALDEVLSAKGKDAKVWFDEFRLDAVRAIKGTVAEGPESGEVEAVAYGIRTLDAVFDAVGTKFDANGDFDRSR